MADIRRLEREPSCDRESSPELSESFEIYLEQKKKKIQEEKAKLKQTDEVTSEDPKEMAKSSDERQGDDVTPIEVHELNDSSVEEIQEVEDEVPETSHQSNDSAVASLPNSPPVQKVYKMVEMTPRPARMESPIDVEDSFLEMEKLCENTLTLNNVSENLTDLTTMDTSEMSEDFFKKKVSLDGRSFLHDVEAPSFMGNMTIFSPMRKTAYENRPSIIMEVTELSTTVKSSASSYQTADAGSTLGEKSECYQTANEESFTFGVQVAKKRAQGFFDDSMNYTKDSLDTTQKPNFTQMTQDSLNNASATFENEESLSFVQSENMNDTLEAIERMLAQANTPAKTPFKKSNPTTPKLVVTPKQQNMPSPTPWSSAKNVLKVTNARGTPTSSPLIKFSPQSATKSPMSNFKLPKQPLSSSKTPQFTSSNSKKFQHIVSPVARYINNTPELPLSANAQNLFGLGSSRGNFNFRDSDAFAKENKAMPSSGTSLPMRAKTKSSNPVIFKFYNEYFFIIN